MHYLKVLFVDHKVNNSRQGLGFMHAANCELVLTCSRFQRQTAAREHKLSVFGLAHNAEKYSILPW